MSSSSKEKWVFLSYNAEKNTENVHGNQELLFLRSLETQGQCLVVKFWRPFSPLPAMLYSSVTYHFQWNPSNHSSLETLKICLGWPSAGRLVYKEHEPGSSM